MNPGPRGAGLVTRAVLLALLIALIGASSLALALRPEVSQALQRMGWSIAYEMRLLLAALLTALIGAALAAAFFGGPERTIRDALRTLDGPDDTRAGEDGLKALTAALQDWRHRLRSVESSRDRLEAGARELADTLEADALEVGGAAPDRAAGAEPHRPVEYEDDALRRLAAAAQDVGTAARRARAVMVALLSRVAGDMTDVGEPLGPVQETLTGMERVIDDLVATYPTMPSLKALQTALVDCGADLKRARQATELVERELNAVRRRMGGGTLERLTARDLLRRDGERTREGME